MSVLQRRRVESFLVESRPWALRQARKKYPHLPADLYEDVYQQACVEMLRGNPRASDRPGLYAYLARVLTGVLGRVHKQWCHQHLDLNDADNPIEVADNSFTPDDAADNRQLSAVLNELMNRRLLAPERAVLQLQIGVGLDPEQVKEALGMSDRQYKRRRYEGVQKLRESLEDYMSGRVCSEHSERLAMAAAGELTAGALEELNAHLAHCGSCRAEIRDLRRTVRTRLALAPWPLLLAAPGVLAAKAAAVVATVKGAGAGTGALGGAKAAVATLAATAAVAGGAIAVSSVGDDAGDAARPAAAPAAQTSQPATAGFPAKPAKSSSEKARSHKTSKRTRKRAASKRRGSRVAASPAPGSTTVAGGSAASSGTPNAVDQTSSKLREKVDGVRTTSRRTVDRVQKALPVPPPVQKLVDRVQSTLDEALAPLAGEG